MSLLMSSLLLEACLLSLWWKRVLQQFELQAASLITAHHSSPLGCTLNQKQLEVRQHSAKNAMTCLSKDMSQGSFYRFGVALGWCACQTTFQAHFSILIFQPSVFSCMPLPQEVARPIGRHCYGLAMFLNSDQAKTLVETNGIIAWHIII